MKMKMKMKNTTQIHLGLEMDINSKYKKCLSMMMLICIKQHLSNISSSIHEKVKQHWDWVEKKRCL